MTATDTVRLVAGDSCCEIAPDLGGSIPGGRIHHQRGRRIDTLGIDENNAPVVIAYQRASNENVINQGLFYLDWLMGHRKDFEWLVAAALLTSW